MEEKIINIIWWNKSRPNRKKTTQYMIQSIILKHHHENRELCTCTISNYFCTFRSSNLLTWTQLIALSMNRVAIFQWLVTHIWMPYRLQISQLESTQNTQYFWNQFKTEGINCSTWIVSLAQPFQRGPSSTTHQRKGDWVWIFLFYFNLAV